MEELLLMDGAPDGAPSHGAPELGGHLEISPKNPGKIAMIGIDWDLDGCSGI